MMYCRTLTLHRGETRFEEIALREPNWPVRASQFAYSFSNQFELPVLFYVLTILEIMAMAGCATAMFSISIELIHSPPDLITSLLRSVICR